MHQLVRRTILSTLAVVFVTGTPAAQEVDARWMAWTGCWKPVATEGRFAGAAGVVCVVPSAERSSVEVLTIRGTTVASRMTIRADGERHAVSRDGCTGTEAATWSPSGTRLYIAEELTCPGGVSHRSSGIMAFTQRYEWLDVRGISSGVSAGVAAARYEISFDTTGLPAEAHRAIAARGPAANNAVLAASAPLTLGDIADVATRTDSGVAATWLMERTRGVKLTIDGKQLVALADQGVPPAVIDVVVAAAHPKTFAFDVATGDPSRVEQPRSGSSRGLQGTAGYPMFGYGGYLYDPWYPWYSYGRYYTPAYGYRYGYGYGWGYAVPYYASPYYGFYPGSQPIIVVNQPSSGGSGYTPEPHGRVVKGRGYTSGGSSDAGRSSSGSGASASSSPGSSGSSGSTSSGSASGGSSGDGGRTAVRKPPGGH